MNKLLLLTSLFLSLTGFCQQYDKVYIENTNIDKNNAIYSIGENFIYDIKILINDSLKFIDKNNRDSLTTDIQNALKELKLSVIKPKPFKRTNKKQTEITYSDYPDQTFVSSTGLVENEHNIWMHPPRVGFLKSLETCPFPYIQLNKNIGYQWIDAMSIGSYWSDIRWGVWEGRLQLSYQYEIIGQEIIKTPLGELDCTKIYAIASSDLGKTSLLAYFNKKYGFVRLEYNLLNGIKVSLALKERSDKNIHNN